MKTTTLGWIVIFIAPWAIAAWLLGSTSVALSQSETDSHSEEQKWLIREVSKSIRGKSFPSQVTRSDDHQRENYRIQYTLNDQLQHEAERLLQAYKPDYGAIVVVEARTGKIRALSSYERGQVLNENLALRGSFPAASIFKMVTASAAVDRGLADPESTILFNGGSHTLYKKNVMSNKVNRWTREVTLREAFARSLNTAFGRLAFEKLEPHDLNEYAYRFGFNRDIQGDLLFDRGHTEIPEEKSYHLAEMASGFNRITQMSPLQGALMAAVVANDGRMPQVQIMEKVTNSSGQVVMQAKNTTSDFAVLSPDGVEKMKILMEETISSGTSRKSFKHLRRDRRFREVEIGGKTGSLTGTNPRGKTDWFVGYAMGENGEKLAIAAVTVHVNLWRVKSAILAQSVVRRHFRDMESWVASHDSAEAP